MLDGLARITGKAKSNLSRTLRTMAGYGLVGLGKRGERGRNAPKVTYDRAELKLPLTAACEASCAGACCAPALAGHDG